MTTQAQLAPSISTTKKTSKANTKKLEDVSILELLFSDIPPDQSIYITCIKPNKQIENKSFVGIAEAEGHAQTRKKFSNVYFGCSTILTTKAKVLENTNERVKYQDCAGTFGVWVEVDLFDAKQPHKPRPKTLEEALNLIKQMPLEPTLISLSGSGGIHCYWKFNKFFVAIDHEQRAFIDSLAYSWWSIADKLARQNNWKLDNVSDLPRILRVNNTLNHKSDPPKPTKIHKHYPSNIYTIEQIKDEIGELTLRPTDSNEKTKLDKVSIVESRFDLNPNTNPDAAQLKALLRKSELAEKSWNYERNDLPSTSEYDFSLAVCALKAGWTDQQIVNLWIAFRRKHKLELTKLTQFYCNQTLTNAKETVRNDEAKPESQTQTFKKLPEAEDAEKPTKVEISIDDFDELQKAKESKKDGLKKQYADAICKTQTFARDAGGWLYVFKNGVYVPEGKREIEFRVKHIALQRRQTSKWSSNLASEVGHYISADANTLWEKPPLNIINLNNGLLHIDLDTGEHRLETHTPEHLSTIQLPVTYDPNAKADAWADFIKTTFPDDSQEVGWQIPAWLMIPYISEQKAVLLLGEGENGKSRYLAALSAFIGKRNVSNMSLQRMQERFSTVHLYGKLANVCADLPSKKLESSEMFKILSEGGLVPAERKGVDQFEFESFARLIFSANHLPRSDDASLAFYRRWLLVPFERRFGEGVRIQKHILDAKLAHPQQLSGVLNEALKVLPSVIKNGLIESASMKCIFRRNVGTKTAVSWAA